MNLQDYRRRLDRLLTTHAYDCRALEEEKVSLQEAQLHLGAVEEAQVYVQTVVEKVQAECHQQIARIVARCLQAIFGEDAYEFKIVFEKKRGRTEASPVFSRDGNDLSDPLNEIGGGVVDVAAFSLRLAELLLSQPRRRRLLILDEPFLNLHGKEYRERVRAMLAELAEELEMQIIIFTQDDTDLLVGKVIEL